MIIWLVGHLIALCIGISLGLIGGGGSILAVPTLVYVMGVPPKSAIAMSLAIVGTVSLLGVIPHWKLGNVQLKTAAMFGLSTMLGAYAGAKIATLPLYYWYFTNAALCHHDATSSYFYDAQEFWYFLVFICRKTRFRTISSFFYVRC